ncbi:MAG TPA: DEAD/DEAH box helicase [Candidatus Lokiarchaeia archaeon]|nr:DEAD/DEAH box helicase [Candidatus Lokiarchaeia archaeon]
MSSKTGTVKWFNRKKGFGFITPDDNSSDVFLHVSALENVNEQKIDAGVRMAFFIEQGDKGLNAVNATLVDSRNDKKPEKKAEVQRKQSTTPKRQRKSSDSSRPAKKQERLETSAIEVPARLPRSELPGDAGTFTDLGLIPTLLQAVQDAGYVEPTPIQTKAIPHVLAGKDLLGCAQTGTGKTAAFALPILQRLTNKNDASQDQKTSRKQAQRRVIRALILAPTRELAIQIGDSFTTYGKYTGLKNCVVFGGVGQDPQVKALEHGIDILVATPGRLLDLIGQKYINLDHVEVLVLDEADRMLDMGFIHDVNRIIKLVPARRQGLLFSATIPKEIVTLAKSFLVKPVQITIAPDQPTLDTIKQSLYYVSRKKKGLLLVDLLKQSDVFTRTLVFTRTKHEANRVVKILMREGISAMPIHGNKSQTARQKALGDFKDGTIRVLVATDVASRGIDVDDISHVIQYDLPNVPETYVHRMGRTGRMGVAGISIAFCDETEKQCLIDIEKFIRTRVPVIKNHPFKD